MRTKDGQRDEEGQAVLEQLGFDRAEVLEIEVKAKLYRELLSQLRSRSLSQAQMSELLGIHQPDVSKFLNGHISKFSVGQLIRFAGRLQMQAEVKIRPMGKRPVGSINTDKQIRGRRVKVAC